jgi:hypothetical protein
MHRLIATTIATNWLMTEWHQNRRAYLADPDPRRQAACEREQVEWDDMLAQLEPRQ